MTQSILRPLSILHEVVCPVVLLVFSEGDLLRDAELCFDSLVSLRIVLEVDVAGDDYCYQLHQRVTS